MRDANRVTEVGWNRESQERRASHRESSASMLTANKIQYEAKNGGAHLILTLPDRIIDFWPGTGLFTDRKTRKNGRGVRNLIKKVSRIIKPAEPHA